MGFNFDDDVDRNRDKVDVKCRCPFRCLSDARRRWMGLPFFCLSCGMFWRKPQGGDREKI